MSQLPSSQAYVQDNKSLGVYPTQYGGDSGNYDYSSTRQREISEPLELPGGGR